MKKCLTFVCAIALSGCHLSGAESRWQEGYEDGCRFAKTATAEQCEARASEVRQLDADYQAGWTDGYEACKFGPEGC